MSYLVIARKWRPRLFDEVVGQTHVTKTLKNAVSTGRIAHAYLFAGPRGVGKTTAARILARSINCEKGPIADPCNECALCKSITDGSSVDVVEIDGASNTGVDSVRELRESIRFVPTACRYKVYIIDEVHMLSTAAFNALLKTLEEPPPHTIFIFATTEVHKIPRTILSRCQRFDFKRIPFGEISGQLKFIASKENITAEDTVFQHIAREADGSMRDAQSLFDQVIASAGTDIKESDVSDALGLMDRSMLYDLSEAVIGGDAPGCLNLVEKIYNFGYDLKKVSLEMLEHVRDLTLMKVTGDSALLELPESEVERLRVLTEKVSIERLHILFSILTRGYEEISRSMTERFSLEMTLLKCATAGELRPVAELIEEVKALKELMEDTPGGAAKSRTGAGTQRSAGGGISRVKTPDEPVNEKPRTAEDRPVEERRDASPPPSGAHLRGGSAGNSAKKNPLPWERESSTPPPVGDENKKTDPPNTRTQAKAASPEDKTASVTPPTGGSGAVDTFLDFIGSRDRALYNALKGSLVSVNGESLRLAAANHGSVNGVLKFKEELLGELAFEHFGRRLSVEITEGGEPAKNGSSPDRDALVDEAVRILGGEVLKDLRRKDV